MDHLHRLNDISFDCMKMMIINIINVRQVRWSITCIWTYQQYMKLIWISKYINCTLHRIPINYLRSYIIYKMVKIYLMSWTLLIKWKIIILPIIRSSHNIHWILKLSKKKKKKKKKEKKRNELKTALWITALGEQIFQFLGICHSFKTKTPKH